jgi:hypothetical protein
LAGSLFRTIVWMCRIVWTGLGPLFVLLLEGIEIWPVMEEVRLWQAREGFGMPEKALARFGKALTGKLGQAREGFGALW